MGVSSTPVARVANGLIFSGTNDSKTKARHSNPNQTKLPEHRDNLDLLILISNNRILS